ncbi:MAG: DUF4852 domain-containing protein [Pseudodesulfovibrio sp.]|nr:DUF4852 domain-containing protein [Pseudodesulfovibrio sp.]
MGADVFVNQVSGAWCQEAVEVQVNLENSSHLLSGGLESFLKKVCTVMQKDCGTVQNARFDVYKDEGKTLVSSYSSSAQKAWAVLKTQTNPKDDKKASESSQVATSKSVKNVPSEPSGGVSKKAVYGSGFEGLFVNYFRFNSDQINRNDYQWWARDRFGKDYRKVRRQEFKLNSLIEKAKSDFTKTLGEWDKNIVTLVVKSSIGNYDFDQRQFKLQSSLNGWNLQNPYYYDDNFYRTTVGRFTLDIDGADLLRDVMMEPSLAEKFIAKRTDKWNRVNRTVYVKINFEIDHSSYSRDGNDISVKGKLHSGTVYNSQKLSAEIFTVENSQVETLLAEMKARQEAAKKVEQERIEKERIAAEARQKEQAKRRFLAQKEVYIARLKDSPLSIRLASYLYERALVRPRRLDNLADARAVAAINGRPVEVGMLVQADESGHQDVETRWPGLLNLNVSDELPELESSDWYLVDGFLSVENNGKLEPAQLNVTHLHACQQDMCTDLASPELIVDRYMKMKFSEGEK